jgi:hypothetical protein
VEFLLLFILGIAASGTGLWLVVRIWKISAPGAIFTFFTGLPAFYFLLKYWDDDEYNIRAPFFISLAVNLLALLLVVSMGSGMFARMKQEAAARERARPTGNPVMERWCGDAGYTYDADLGTCVDDDATQAASNSSRKLDVMDRLENHFADNGMETRVSALDESSPGARNFSKMPEMQRVMQFEFKSNSVMPTLAMVAECASSDDCGRIERRLDQPNSPFSVARNGKLLFMGFQMLGKDPVIEEAKELFQSFEAI